MPNPSLANNPMVDDWMEIDAEGRVHVRSGKVDIGQRISTAIAVIAAEELGLDPDDIVVEARQTGLSPDEGVTAGSNSIEQSGGAVRQAAATARRYLLQRAAEKLETSTDRLELDGGVVREKSSNRSLSLTEIAGGGKFGIAVDPEAAPRPPEHYRQIGRPAKPRGAFGQVSGGLKFVHDMAVEAMLHARVVRPPHARARLQQLDSEICRRIESEGINIVRDGSFIAVAGPDEYQTIRAGERLAAAAKWDGGGGLGEDDVFSALTQNDNLAFPVIEGTPQKEPVPQPGEPPQEAAITLSARYERPYQMHGSIGPSAAAALWQENGLSVWTHSQGIYPLRDTLSEALSLPVENIILHHAAGAGCYGHNGADDAAFEAALVAQALPGRTILLKWSRQDEHAWEPYAPAMAVEMRAAMDRGGTIVQWSGEAYSDTHMGRPRQGPNGAGPRRFLANRFRKNAGEPWQPQPNFMFHGGLHRNLDPYYGVGERRLVKHLVRGLPHRTSSMRCLGAVANVFAIESFMDELAAAAGIDAVDFRLRHLDDPRARDVLEEAAEGIGWQKSDPADGHGKGIAFARYKNVQTYAAIAVELVVDDAAQVRLKRAFIAADAGEVIDSDGLKAQLEGGFMQAASWAIYEKVTHDRDGITSRDWETYPILRFDNVPEIEVRLLDRPGERPLGAGEAAGGPAVAAIANAIARATSLRLRRMPFDAEAITQAALGGDI